MTTSQDRQSVMPVSKWQLFWGHYSFSLTTSLSILECIDRFRHHLRFEYETSWGLAFALALTTKYRDLDVNASTFCVELSSVPFPIIGTRAIGRCYDMDDKTSIDFEVGNLPGNYIFVFVPAVFLCLSVLVAMAFPMGLFLFFGMLVYFIFATKSYMGQQRQFCLGLSESIRATLPDGSFKHVDEDK